MQIPEFAQHFPNLLKKGYPERVLEDIEELSPIEIKRKENDIFKD